MKEARRLLVVSYSGEPFLSRHRTNKMGVHQHCCLEHLTRIEILCLQTYDFLTIHSEYQEGIH